MKRVLILIFSPFLLFSQINISFHEYTTKNNINADSFAPQMVLAHGWGQFQKVYRNPVMSRTKGQWDSKDVADPCVVVTDSAVIMYYDGDNNDRYKIGRAKLSDDGWVWEKQGMLLEQGAEGWDSYHVIDPVVLNSAGKWMMWFSGNSSDSPLGYRIGVAESRDNGQSWKRVQTQPVIELDAQNWDGQGIAYADVLFDHKTQSYKMWYSGFSGPFASLGLAESADGINWKRVGVEPVYAVLPGMIAPEIIFDGEKYRMWYAQLYIHKGMRTKIAYAESDDGKAWTFKEDVLKPRERWESKRLMAPAVAFYEQQAHLFYCAQKGGKWAIGEAVADLHFKPLGEWISKKLTRRGKTLRMIVEQPANTTIQLLLSENNNDWQEVPKILSRNVPGGREEWRYKLPEKADSFFVKLKLGSGEKNRSPVIYSLKQF